MRAAMIVNPVSGRGVDAARAGGSRLEQATRMAQLAGIEVDVVATTGSGHARELAGSFVSRGYSRIVAWGGDGTINEVAGPLIGARAVLGIVPAGSGDGFAHGLALPRDTTQAVRVALTGAPRPVDVGYLGERHFLNIGGLGFDAAVAVRFNRRANRGTRGYVMDCLRTVWSYQCATYDLAYDGERAADARFVIAFANGREYGSGLVLAPHASPVDGWLDMAVVSGGSPLRQFWRARRLLWRRLAPAEGIRRIRVKSATIRGEQLTCHVDGETFETSGPIHVRIAPGALMVAGVAE